MKPKPTEAPRLLPYGRQLIEEDDVAAVAAVLRGDFLTTGPTVADFERAFAARVGARLAASCSSGTAALHLAALALRLGPGDAVIVPSLSFVATANAVDYVGATVVFADVDAGTGVMTAAHVDEALVRAEREGRRPRAVFPVHLNGQCAEMAEIGRLAADRDLLVVEDACHALGGAQTCGDGETRPVGGCGDSDMAIFSLHPVKVIAMGEGGVVTTNSRRLHERLVRLRNHGLVREPAALENRELAFDAAGEPNPWYYEMPEPGYNYRASDIHCALGLSQLGKLERFVAARAELVARYDEALAELAPIVRPLARVPWSRPAWHLYVVQIDFQALSLDRAALMHRLRDQGIFCQVHYLPIHLQPYYLRKYGDHRLPGAESYYARALSLPLFVGMSLDDVDRVVAALASVCRG